MFGFTEGSDVGEPGSREAEFSCTGAFGKGGGVSCQAVEQEAAYDAAATDRFGDELIDSALYVGPTMHLQMEPKAFLSLAWSTQVAASLRSLMAEVIEAWNQSDLSRQKAQMVFGVEF